MSSAGETHFVGRVAQKALITNDEGAVLLVRTIGEPQFAFPGGRLNVGEEPIVALKREVKEEIGIDIEVLAPCATATWVSPKGEPHFLVVYGAKLKDPDASLIGALNEIEEIRWVRPDEFDSIQIFKEYRKVLQDLFGF